MTPSRNEDNPTHPRGSSGDSPSFLLAVIFHLLFTCLSCAISLGLLFAIGGLLTLPHPNPSSVVDSIFNPLFWVPGLFVGAVINRFVRHPRASFAPAVVGAQIVLGIFFWEASLFRHSAYELAAAHGHVWRYELERLFAPVSSFSPEEADRSLLQLVVTFPFLSSIAYSVGAWMGFKFGGGVAETVSATTNE
jgi:hypothetical protein